jgi:DNA-directed RNA polymerase subunit RPC12/RpoP
MNNLKGYTCQTCGKIFETKEEFDNRHKKNKKNNKQSDSKKKD